MRDKFCSSKAIVKRSFYHRRLGRPLPLLTWAKILTGFELVRLRLLEQAADAKEASSRTLLEGWRQREDVGLPYGVTNQPSSGSMKLAIS